VRDLYNRIFGALGLIIGVIVVFVVTNAMAMAIIERTREIGTLRALGTLPGAAAALARARRDGARRRRCVRSARCSRWRIGRAADVPGARCRRRRAPQQAIRCRSSVDPRCMRDAARDGAPGDARLRLVARRTVHTPVVEALAHT
jgi:putative ABC transport system permease protein